MKKTLIKELLRFAVTVLSAVLGSEVFSGCTVVPFFNF